MERVFGTGEKFKTIKGYCAPVFFSRAKLDLAIKTVPGLLLGREDVKFVMKVDFQK